MEQREIRPVDRISQLAQWLIDNEVLKSSYAFEKVCGLSRFYIRNLNATEKGNAGVDTIAKIYDIFPQINLEWLVTGKGKMFKIKGTDDEIAEAIRKHLILRLIQ